ncbi:unnamed protein product [Arabis nemorensis]|uniref:Uncharacterized protein n=1 Tax=Arabis nemorensis TaxID=586526 RepID=A0A565C9W6_9BRAS|nr:unnamed protein product [Arabis nemorensis]
MERLTWPLRYPNNVPVTCSDADPGSLNRDFACYGWSCKDRETTVGDVDVGVLSSYVAGDEGGIEELGIIGFDGSSNI